MRPPWLREIGTPRNDVNTGIQACTQPPFYPETASADFGKTNGKGVVELLANKNDWNAATVGPRYNAVDRGNHELNHIRREGVFARCCRKVFLNVDDEQSFLGILVLIY
jgi:hypothetical protein